MGKHGLYKDLAKVADVALKAGWTMRWHKSHVILEPPGGGLRVVLPGSPRNAHTAVTQARTALRRAGVDI